jgi:hypothetical protein
MQPIPLSLAPFFQEYDLTKLTPENNSHTIIERVLQFGNRAEIKWLFDIYPEGKIKEWVQRWSKDKLPEPHRTFWRIVLEVSE